MNARRTGIVFDTGEVQSVIVVDLFSKSKGCGLCEKAHRVLQLVQRDIRFTLVIHDITKDPALMERFKESIPVILINGEKAFQYRVDSETLRKKLAAAEHTPDQ